MMLRHGQPAGWTNDIFISYARLLNADLQDLRGTHSDLEYFFDSIYNQIESDQINVILKENYSRDDSIKRQETHFDL